MKSPPCGGPSSPATSELTLGELLPATRLAQADLLTLDFACIASDQASLAQGGLQACVVVDQRAGDAVAHRTGLAGFAAAGHVHHDVELADHLGQFQRLTHDPAAGLAREEQLD